MNPSKMFWQLETGREMRVLDEILNRRFHDTLVILDECLMHIDPMEMVYPDNPGEYNDVVREIIVQLSPVNGDLTKITNERLEEIILDSLYRCFGEDPRSGSMRELIDMIHTKAKTTT